MKMNLHCFANLIPIMILALFSNSGLINATEVGKRTDALEASAWNESKWISAVDALHLPLFHRIPKRKSGRF